MMSLLEVSAHIEVVHPYSLRFQSFPGELISGEQVEIAVEVLEDGELTSDSVVVFLSIGEGSGTIDGETEVAAASGVARFVISISETGNFTLVASASEAESVESDVFVVSVEEEPEEELDEDEEGEREEVVQWGDSQMFKRLRSFVPRSMRGRVWDALIDAVATGDEYISSLARDTFFQQFLPTAEGVYLERHAANVGVQLPSAIGMSSEQFRKLVIQFTNRKLTTIALGRLLEAFYGPKATRAYATSEAGPFALRDGDRLLLRLNEDDQVTTVTFRSEDFVNISSATALEVSLAISANLSGGYCVVEDEKVIIYSNAIGLAGSVEILGGSAVGILGLPGMTEISLEGDCVISRPSENRTRYTIEGAGAVRVGQTLNVFGYEIDQLNHGSFPVVDVSEDYVEVDSRYGTEQVLTVEQGSITISRPTKRTVYSNRVHSIAVSPTQGVIKVLLPATSEIVERSEETGAYLPETSLLSVTSIEHDGETMTIHHDGGKLEGVIELSDVYLPPPSSEYVIEAIANPPESSWDSDHNLMVTSSGKIMLLGPEPVVFDHETEEWVSLPTNDVFSGRTAIAEYHPNKILIVNEDGEARVFDSESYEYAPTGSMATGAAYASAAVVPGGVLVCGEWESPLLGDILKGEVWNPATGHFTPMFSVAASAFRPRVVVLQDGRAFIFGYDSTVPGEYLIWNSTTWETEQRQLVTADGGVIDLESINTQYLFPYGVDGKILITGGEPWPGDNKMYLFSPNTLTAEEVEIPPTLYRPLLEIIALPFNAKATKPSEVIVSLVDEKKIFSFDVETGRVTELLDGFIADAVAPLPEGKKFIADLTNGMFGYLYRPHSPPRLNGTYPVLVSGPGFVKVPYVSAPFSAEEVTGTLEHIAANGGRGPYLLDHSSFAVTSVTTKTTAPLYRGRSYTYIHVEDATAFPDEEGFVTFSFEDGDIVSVRYRHRPDSTTLLLDGAHFFEKTVPSGASITLLASTSEDIPHRTYAAASTAGREAASEFIDNAVAVGSVVDKEVVYPGDRGLGGEGIPSGTVRVPDRVVVFGGENVDDEVSFERGEL